MAGRCGVYDQRDVVQRELDAARRAVRAAAAERAGDAPPGGSQERTGAGRRGR